MKFYNKKSINEYQKRIIFIDLHSNHDQHLTGNSSLIYKFFTELNNYEYIYVCKKNAHLFFKNWFEELGLNNIKIYSFCPQLCRQDKIIILYPEYERILEYLYLKLRVSSLISVIHGHLNSYYNKKLSKNIKYNFKNNLKNLFFSIFDNIICYSKHILNDSRTLMPKFLHHKLVLINEYLNFPKLNKTKNFIKSKEIIIGFINYPENKRVYSLLKLLEINNNIRYKKGWEQDLRETKSYLEFLNSCDILIFGKNNSYNLQVSGVINDCISLKKIIVSNTENKHYKHLIEKGLIKHKWNITNLISNIKNIPSLNDIEEFKSECRSYLKILESDNTKTIHKLIDSNKVVLSYQGREDGGGLLDLYRFAYHEQLNKKNFLKVLTRSKKKLGLTFLSKNLSYVENQCELINNYSCFLSSNINQVIFIMPNIRDLALLILIKILNKKIITTSIIHNPPDFISTKNYFLNKVFNLIQKLMILFADDIVFLSQNVGTKWKKIKKYRIVPLPIVDSQPTNKLFKSNQSILSPKKNKKLLILGRYLPYKNLDILINSLKSDQNISKHDLIIAGNDYPNKDINLLKNLCFKKNWKFKYINSFINMANVEKLIEEADYVLFIYKFASQSGFMHLCKELNKPIICTNVGGLRENMKNGGKGFCVNVNSDMLTEILNMIYSENLDIPSYNKIKKDIVI